VLRKNSDGRTVAQATNAAFVSTFGLNAAQFFRDDYQCWLRSGNCYLTTAMFGGATFTANLP
jgi:hypothetical protein